MTGTGEHAPTTCELKLISNSEVCELWTGTSREQACFVAEQLVNPWNKLLISRKQKSPNKNTNFRHRFASEGCWKSSLKSIDQY
jgi:hypothetical protein